MTSIFKSRHLQVSILSATLLFALCLGASLWISAFEERQQAYNLRSMNFQENVIFELTDALAVERQLMYALFNGEFVDEANVEKLKILSGLTDKYIRENLASFSEMKAAALKIAEGHDHFLSHGAYSNVSLAREATESSAVAPDNPLAKQDNDTSIAESIAQLRKHDDYLYQQLMMPKSARDPRLGISQFNDYTRAIESIDEIRHALHIQSSKSLPEQYLITKLKDAFWDFRESAAQTTSLLEGVTALSENLRGIGPINDHANMLMDLNVRVDYSWNTLYVTIMASGSDTMLSDANQIAVWYNNNFRGMSYELMASTLNNSVSLIELEEWLVAAHQLSALSEGVRFQSVAMTSALINSVVHRTNMNLIRVSILLFFFFGMIVASVIYFQRVDRQAHQDELTGLDNRRMFSLALEKCLSAPESQAGVLMIDLDRFKQINDTMGHSAGDALLKDVSTRIAKEGVNCLSVARLGGDEFALLFDEQGLDEMMAVAGNVRQRLIDPFRIGGSTLIIGSSIGIAKTPLDAETPDALIQAADLAMYCAKKSGTNQISVYDSEVDQSMMLAAKTVNELQSALQNGEFELYYQPQFNIAESKVLSAEALIRWNHPERGFLTPNHFITIAEENGLMPAIGNWVIEQACCQAAEWLYEKKMPLRVAINISADHFFQTDFVKLIVDSLEKYKLPPQLLEIEVTESVAMSDIDLVVKSLQQLRDLSIHVALDDFGTGYSSLSYLQELPLDTLKIDKSFIQNMLKGNTQKESITETIIALGNRLNLETVAEGVETLDQLDAVSDMQISVVQGFYYSRPVSASELEYVVGQLNASQKDNKAA